MKTATEILDGFPAFQQRKHKGKREVSGESIRQSQIAYLEKHLKAAYQQGYRKGVLGACV